MKRIFVLILFLVILSSCRGVDKEYVFFETEVLANSEYCGSGRNSGGCRLYSKITYLNSEVEIETGMGFMSCELRKNDCVLTEGYNPKVGQIIIVEGIYDHQNSFLKVLNSSDEVGLIVPKKEYVSFITKITDFESIDVGVKTDDWYNFTFRYKNEDYVFGVNLIAYGKEVGFKPGVGDKIKVEGLLDQANGALFAMFIHTNGKVFKTFYSTDILRIQTFLTPVENSVFI